jgi:hypothetical protein
MSFVIQVDHNNKIIRYNHTGNIVKEDIGKAWEVLLQKEEFTQLKYNLLTNYAKANSNIDIEDINLICEHLVSLEPILRDKKQAFIMDDPTGTAISILFQSEVYKKIGFIVKVFSTENAAVKWLTE